MPNRISHPYQLEKSMSSLRAVANSAEPDQAMHFVASDWVVHCLPMPHKVDPRLTWVKTLLYHFARQTKDLP